MKSDIASARLRVKATNQPAQNPTAKPHNSPTTAPFQLTARQTLVLNTSVAFQSSGALTVTHDGPYGSLVGKAVALEPATGFSFDTPMRYRPR